MNRRTAIIGFVAAGLLLAIWFFLLWGPQGGQLEDANDREAAAENMNQQLEVRVARLLATQERAPALQAELTELRAAVPDGPDLAQFILDAHTVAEEAGVEFLTITQTPPAPSPTGGPSSIALTITINGGYFEVLDYLDRFASLSRVVVVDTINLAPGAAELGPLTLGVNLTARMFTTGAEAAATPAPTTPVVSTETTTTTTPAGGSTTIPGGPGTDTTPTTTGAAGG